MLHGSAVVSSRALCLLGPSTAGKSTIAALLVQRGLALLSEGLVTVSLDGAAPLAQPGPHVFRLWADVIERLGADPGSFPEVGPAIGKRHFPAANVVSSPAPISAIYILRDAEADAFEELRGTEAAVALLKNLYLEGQLDERQLGDALLRCARIADAARVCRISRRKVPETLQAVVDMIATDFATSDDHSR